MCTRGAGGLGRPRTGQADEPASPPPRDPPATALDGPVIRHLAPRFDQAENTEITGLIGFDGGFVHVTSDDVGLRYLVVWPASTVWNPKTNEAVSPGGDAVGFGDVGRGGGGYHTTFRQ